MAQKLEVTNIQLNQTAANVSVADIEGFIHKKIMPEGRMLVDSENLAFIYILDVEEEFIYISFPVVVWEDIKNVLDEQLPLFIFVSEEVKIPLTMFHEELEFLISNIEENSNYGDSMVQAVSNIFKLA